jgi:RNA polymerase sigma-70 factor (ECF subfamily)
MHADSDLAGLLDRLRTGDQDAAALLFHRFAHRLIGLARLHLGQRLRPKIDPDDILQSAFKSFFCRFADGQFQLDSWDGLWSLLVVITLRKCGHKVEHYRAACRDAAREVVLFPEDSWPNWRAVARAPRPEQGVLLAELVETVMRSLKDDCQRRIFELTLQGCSCAEIATQVGRTERTVYRVQQRIRNLLSSVRDCA